MLLEVINSLTREQKAKLLIRGIESPLISAWRTGRRRPTYAQCVYLAEITGTNLQNLLTEIALKEVPEEIANKFRNPIKN
jgi:PHP family Zn ribbon phosphoesterase